MKIIPVSEGKYRQVNSFLKIVEFIYKTLESNAKIELIDFVYHVKLSDVVRTNLSGYTKLLRNPNTNTSIQNYLIHVSQNKSTASNFKDKILNLTNELSLLQINKFGPTTNEDQKRGIASLNHKLARFHTLTHLHLRNQKT